MKYRIGNSVLNSDHIVKVTYFAANPDDPNPIDRQSGCGIKTTLELNATEEHYPWSAFLRGAEADAFWESYSGDALNVSEQPHNPITQDEREYIYSISTENTGGDVLVDVVALKSGRVLTITDESIAVWKNVEAWQDSVGPVNAIYMEV